mgnify:CR=1 FL=1
MQKISIVYITLNAEKYLLESLNQTKKLTNDILIVDSGSTDDTVKIAHSTGARVITQDWLGFALQKQFAIDNALYDSVLFLDADEILTDDAISAVKEHLPMLSSGEVSALSFRRKNYFQGKWICHGSWWPDRVTRLVNRQSGHIKQVAVHESWEASGKTISLDVDLIHHSYRSYSELIQKADRYSSLAAEQLLKDGKSYSNWAPLVHGVAAFFRLFVLKRGFKDGIEGAAIAMTSGLASFMKYAKLQELKLNSDRNKDLT